MKYIKNRFLILESKNLKNEIVSDICIAMSLINPDFLSPLLDKGLVNRYTQNSTAFAKVTFTRTRIDIFR